MDAMPPWRGSHRGCLLAAGGLAAGGLLTAAEARTTLGPLAQFEQLWDAVVVDQQSRGTRQERAPPVRHACQYGLSNTTLEMARLMLRRLRPAVDELEVHDAEGPLPGRWLSQMQAEFGSRVQRGVAVAVPTTGPPSADEAALAQDLPPCDLVLFSEASPRFALERVLPRLRDSAVIAWISETCADDTSKDASPTCNLLNSMWSQTSLMRRGYCLPGVCMSRVPVSTLHDPNVVPLECDGFATEAGSNASVGEFGQDWFLYWNFLRGEGHRHPSSSSSSVPRGVYVDVGASLPFDYSNTVMFDRCFGWEGVCVEPNPHFAALLEAYRGCRVFPNCVDEQRVDGKVFTDRDGEVQFSADCLPLGEILDRAGLRGRRIDVLSVDVEHGELSALSGLPLEEFDARFLVVEVSPGARWLEVDTLLLPRGYAKVAVLGRDVVYAKLEELGSVASHWPFLRQGEPSRSGPRALLPRDWAEFHQRVVDEELEEEMRKERKAFYLGLRRLGG